MTSSRSRTIVSRVSLSPEVVHKLLSFAQNHRQINGRATVPITGLTLLAASYDPFGHHESDVFSSSDTGKTQQAAPQQPYGAWNWYGRGLVQDSHAFAETEIVSP